MNIAEKLESFRPMLLGRAYSLSYAHDWPREIEPEDLVSDTLRRALAAAHQFRGSSLPELSAWLIRVLKSELSDQCDRYNALKRGSGRTRSIEDFLNESQSRVETFLAANLPSASSIVAKQELIDRIYSLLAQLPKEQREILMLRYNAQLEIDEIAQKLNITGPAVAGRLSRATKLLASMV